MFKSHEIINEDNEDILYLYLILYPYLLILHFNFELQNNFLFIFFSFHIITNIIINKKRENTFTF